MIKKIIVAIVGKSGSGKTVLSKQLKEKCGIPYICSYTTRPMRQDEVNGVEHIFLPHDSNIPNKEDMLAYAYFGGYHYWALHEQIEDIATYVIDEKALVEMIDKFSDRYHIIKVYVDRSEIDVDSDRMERDNDRMVMDDTFYDIIVNNNGSYNDFINNKTLDVWKYIREYLIWQ
jgi:guanylate kinase